MTCIMRNAPCLAKQAAGARPQPCAIPPTQFIRPHRRCARRREVCGARATQLDSPAEFITVAEVQEEAANRGLVLSISELGPFYRITCRTGTDDKILATTNGWTAPLFKYMHCEALQVFAKAKEAKANNIKGGPLGLGLLVGVCTFAYAHERGITRAEILAIKDYDDQHKRLIKYYKFYGFSPLKEVGDNGLSDLLDQIVWGGVGTKMEATPTRMLERWTRAVRRGLESPASEAST